VTTMTRYQIGEQDRQWIDHIRKQPVGIQPPEVIRLLNRMRGEAIEGKYCLVIDRPHQEWVVAEMQGRGKPLKYHNIRVSSREEGEWEIFKLRWHRHTGETLE